MILFIMNVNVTFVLKYQITNITLKTKILSALEIYMPDHAPPMKIFSSTLIAVVEVILYMKTWKSKRGNKN